MLRHRCLVVVCLRGGRLALAVALAALAVPVAVSQEAPAVSTPTALYFHIFDTFNRFPINTQAQDVAFFQVGGTSFPTVASQGYDFNTIYGFSTAGPVEYDFIENGRPRFHPEHGIAADVLLDSSVQPVAHLYFDVRDVYEEDYAPMAMPTLTVRITVRSGDDFGDEAKLDAGTVLIEGRRTVHLVDVAVCPAPAACTSPVNPALANQSAPDGTPFLVPDASGVAEMAIPLEIASESISRAEAFNVRVDWWQDPGGAVGEDALSTGYVRLAADAAHRPRIDLAVTNPISVEYVHPQVAGGVLLVHTAALSPWGTYDVDVDNLTLAVDGPSKPLTVERFVVQNAHSHGAHDAAAEVSFLWRFRDEGAAPGDYRIRVEVPNLQGTARAEGGAGFHVDERKAYGTTEAGEVLEPLAVEEAQNESPAGALLAALSGLAIAAFARRRAP